MPARTLATPLLQYHQKAMVVAKSASFIGLGRFPSAHIREKWNMNKTVTVIAMAKTTSCALCSSHAGMKGPPLEEYISKASAMRSGEACTAASTQVSQVA